MSAHARGGTCADCGEHLVQTIHVLESRTYHPASSDTSRCKVLIPIDGTAYSSFDVPEEYFIPEQLPQDVRP